VTTNGRSWGLIGALVIGVSMGCQIAPQDSPGARNVILFIGDGLGPSQLALGMNYAREIEGRKLNVTRLAERGMTGYTLPLPHEDVVTDSAAAASQLATGEEVRNEAISVDKNWQKVETILEWAERRGMATGIVTTTRLTHATPAAFASHSGSRYVDGARIAIEMMEGVEIEVLLGGGARHFVPRGSRASDELRGMAPALDGESRRSDNRDLIAEARSRGYAIAGNVAALTQASAATKLLGLFSSGHLPYVLDSDADDMAGVPRLVEMTEAALAVLERHEGGFFLMVEGGRIDHAGHQNDAGTMLHETLAFDEAVGAGMRFQDDHPDTLIIVTADHATGGFTFNYVRRPTPGELVMPGGEVYPLDYAYAGRKHLALLGDQTASYQALLDEADGDPAKLIESVKRGTGLALAPGEAVRVLERDADGHAVTRDFADFYPDWEDNPSCLLARALSRQSLVSWSTGGHTSDPVLTFAWGPGAEALRGVYRNTHIHEVMREALAGDRP
jgi:alkaline phosphatase